MVTPDLLALADEYEAGLNKCIASGYEEFGAEYQQRHRMVIDSLRFRAHAQGRQAPASEREELAADLQAYASKYSDDWAMASPSISWSSLSTIIASLRAPEAADAGAVATSNYEELIYLANQQMFARQRYAEDDAGLIRESKVIEWALRRTAAGIAAPPAASADAVRAELIEQEAKRRCMAAGWPLDRLACQDHRFQHDNRTPLWKANYVYDVERDIKAVEKAGFTVLPALTAPVAGADAGMRERTNALLETCPYNESNECLLEQHSFGPCLCAMLSPDAGTTQVPSTERGAAKDSSHG